MTRILLVVCACLGGLMSVAAAQDNEPSLTVSNFEYGTVCNRGSGPEICTQTGDIQLTGSGTCVYATNKYPCTWYGYSFDYDLASSSVRVDCVGSSSAPSNMGNPEGELAIGATHHDYGFWLSHDQHHFINPQYMIVGEDSPALTQMTQSCSYRGKKLFDFTLTLHRAGSAKDTKE